MKTKGQMEAEISKVVVKIVRECVGRGPSDTRTYIIEDLILVREKGVLIPAEQHLLENEDQNTDRDLVKQLRGILTEKSRGIFEEAINRITGRKVLSLHADISTKTGERIIIFTLDGPIESG